MASASVAAPLPTIPDNSPIIKGRFTPDLRSTFNLDMQDCGFRVLSEGRDVRVMGHRGIGVALSDDHKETRVLVEGALSTAVSVGMSPLAEAAGSSALPVAVGDCPKSIAYGDGMTAVSVGYSAEAHRVGIGGVAVAISTGSDGVVVSGGEDCLLVVIYWDKVFTAKVGEGGFKPNTPYSVNPNTGEWFEEDDPFMEDHPPSQFTGLETP
jgi:hypothetical protein